jgi:hypothetical protein
MGAVNSALEQFDRALLTTVTAVEDSEGAPSAGTSTGGKVQVPDGLAGMDTARLAAQAALVAANTSISMLDEAIKLADYNHKDDADSRRAQQSSASQQGSSQTVQLMAFAQLVQSPEAAQPEPAQPAPEEQVASSSASSQTTTE